MSEAIPCSQKSGCTINPISALLLSLSTISCTIPMILSVSALIITIVDNDNKSAEIGFIVHPDFWEQGIASDIAATMVKYGFKVLKLNRIWGSLVYCRYQQ